MSSFQCVNQRKYNLILILSNIGLLILSNIGLLILSNIGLILLSIAVSQHKNKLRFIFIITTIIIICINKRIDISTHPIISQCNISSILSSINTPNMTECITIITQSIVTPKINVCFYLFNNLYIAHEIELEMEHWVGLMRTLARYCRKIFVGDIHGCFDELMLLLNRLQHDPQRDELYFVGDLAVKGPRSNDVIEFVRTTPKTYSVMGNHDYELLRVARACSILNSDIKIPSFQFSTYYAKDPWLMTQHIECAKTLSDSNLEYMSSLPLSLSPHPKLKVVHAGVIPHIDLSKQNPWTLMNVRNVIEKPTPKHVDLTVNNKPVLPRQSLEGTGYHDSGVPWIDLYTGPEHVFFGHDAKRALQIGAYATGLDTGCCYGGSLTAAIIKCDEMNDDLINEIHEKEYQFEEWEMDNGIMGTYVSATGVVYRLMKQPASDVYRNPYKDIGNRSIVSY